MSSDDSSDLSSVPSEDESELKLEKKDGILRFFSKVEPVAKASKADSPPPPERAPSPPHEYVLADNPDIAFIVMFRSRFNEAFTKSLPNFGPQELERGVVDTVPAEYVEQFLCALLGLLLNRKQDVKAGHYNRALEEAIQTHKAQWARDWESKNPLAGGATFTTMSPAQRLTLLRTLILWSLSSSDTVKGIIAQNYKQNRHDDDLNQPLSVQPWGSDSYRRRYYLIEGLDDTHFRIYRESSHMSIKRTWWSVAGDIDELKALAEKLSKEDGGQKARLLSDKMLQAIPRFEATEEKRKRREYRQIRKHQFKRPEPNFSLYEGRTRGKRIKYTYSDEEDEGYSDTTSRRSTRNTGTHTPAEPAGPVVTQSGRQVRSRHHGAYGESLLSESHTPGEDAASAVNADVETDEGVTDRRPRRAAAAKSSNGLPSKSRRKEDYDFLDDDEEDESEQDYGDDEDDDEHVVVESDGEDDDDLEDEEMEDDIFDESPQQKSLVVKLSVNTTPEKAVKKRSVTPEKLDAQPSEPQGHTVGESQPEVKPEPVAEPIEAEAAHSAPSEAPVNGDTTIVAVKAIDIPEPQQSIPSPLSPSLAFRGSPEKLYGFPKAVDVGQGGL